MSKKHFIDLASRLRSLRPHGENKFATRKAKHLAEGKLLQWREMVREIASFCATQNGRFDRERFLTAAGMD